jgi:hypothetical protein
MDGYNQRGGIAGILNKSGCLNGEQNSIFVASRLRENGLWRIPGEESSPERMWRISPRPFKLEPQIVDYIEKLGPALLSFYRAMNQLYLRNIYPWVSDYLDRGKPESLVEHGRMNYQKRMLPRIIRPDLILTESGPKITELDSVPGGFGNLGAQIRFYAELGCESIGYPDGIVDGFDAMIRDAAGMDDPVLAIMVSQESDDYRPEMQWIAGALRERGRRAFCIAPQEIIFTEESLYAEYEGERFKIDVLYRFFELFDLKNIPKAELVAYAAKKKRVVVTPPYKHYLEEKMLLALIHHPMLKSYWTGELGEQVYNQLRDAVPETWILDNRPVPPHAVIAGFNYRGEPVNDWRVIREGTQKERRIVIKPSGFSALAWGSHGVKVGHNMAAEDWAGAVDEALASFDHTPWVLQHFYEGKKFEVEYLNKDSGELTHMFGRIRLGPYYFVVGDQARLSGALATITPLDKKLIHGMRDAVMAPAAE